MSIRIKTFMQWLGFALVYFISAKLSLLLAVEQATIAPLWPPSGIAIALLVCKGRVLWPAIFIGAFTSNLSISIPVHSAMLVASGNTLEALVAAHILTRCGTRATLETTLSVLKLLSAAGLGAGISASFGIFAQLMNRTITLPQPLYSGLTWFLGNLIGSVIFVPLIISWTKSGNLALTVKAYWELVAIVTLSALAALILFSPWQSIANSHPAVAIVFLPLAIWSAYRFQLRGAATYASVISAVSILASTYKFGPFVGLSTNESLVLLQIFIISSAVPTLLLAASIHEKKVAHQKLEQTTRELEEHVNKRTADLKQTNQSLFSEIHERKSTIEAMQSLLNTSTIQPYKTMLTQCVQDLASLYQADHAFVGGFVDKEKSAVRTLVVWSGGKLSHNFEYSLSGSPCDEVLKNRLEFVNDNAQTRYPEATILKDLGAQSYFAAPLHTHQGETRGIVAVMNHEAITLSSWSRPILSLYAKHIAATLERQSNDEERKLAETVFSSSIQCIAIADKNANILRVNPTFETVTGYREEEIKGKSFRLLKSGRHSKTFYQGYWQSLMIQGSWQGEIWNRRKNGEIFPVWQTATSVRDDTSQEIVNYVSIFHDITEKKVSEDHIFHLAHYDSLTGLYNRRAFLMELNSRIERCSSNQTSLAIIYLDLDNFKLINDASGHSVGDLLLKEVADRLRYIMREDDVAARLGGDEFVLLVSDYNGREDLTVIAKKIIAELILPTILNHTEVVITASLGISLFPEHGVNQTALLTNADTAMYYAKQSGRNNFQFFAPSMAQHAQARLTLESEMRKALDNREFILHYQPLINVVTHEIIGCEALIRWQHPKRGLVSPGEFIPVAEETGLIHLLGAWVLREACTQFAEWISCFGTGIKLSINISGRQFRDKKLLPELREILSRFKIPPQQLDIEITESVLMENTSDAIALLYALKQLGVSLSVDDFGTGYSSLAYLKRFPIDRLKIDQSFVRELATDPDDAAIVNATISLSKNLHLRCVAEGVESEDQIRFLKNSGCIEMQGFYFSKPVDATHFGALLKNGLTLNLE